MLFDYINGNYDKAEPIFMYELPYTSKNALRQEIKRLTDEGKLIRLYNGVYYKPYKTIFGTNGKMSINKFLEKKYLLSGNESIGFISGISMFNKYGFTSQIPSVIEVVTNVATTKQRKIKIDGYSIIEYKPVVSITNENINEIEFLTMMIDIDKYSELSLDELKSKLKEYVEKKKLRFNLIKEYLPLFPDKVYKNIYNGGLMNELV